MPDSTGESIGTAIVTGAGSGLGRAIAQRLGSGGYAVLCADLNGDAAALTSASLKGSTAIDVDVSDESDCERMVAAVLERYGRVDVVVANAGISGRNQTADTTSRNDWQRVIDVNLTGVWLTSKFAIPHMVAAGGGSIINMASVAGLVGVPTILSYAAAKGGVIALTRQMAVDYGAARIRVNCVCPGEVPTEMVRTSYALRMEHTGASIESQMIDHAVEYPIGRLGNPADIANAVAFLAGSESDWVTGQALAVDGGYTAK